VKKKKREKKEREKACLSFSSRSSTPKAASSSSSSLVVVESEKKAMAALLIDPDALDCPLCAEQLDATELCLRLCECDYKICLFCYQRLVDDAAAEMGVGAGGGGSASGGALQQASSSGAPRCPNCRTPYDTARIDGQAPDPAE